MTGRLEPSSKPDSTRFAQDSANAVPGFWHSAFGAAEAVAAATEFSELHANAVGLFWLEYDPATAVHRLCHRATTQNTAKGAKSFLTPAGYSIRSRVNEYGGGSFCASADAVFFVDEQDQQIYSLTLNSGTFTLLTQNQTCRFGDLFYDNALQRILCVRETHAESVTQDLVAIDSRTGRVTQLASGADFYASPQVNDAGSQVAWVEWNVTAMPWDKTRLAVAVLDTETGALAANELPSYLRPGDGESQSILLPRFDRTGALWCISDHQGWWQLYRVEPNGPWLCLDSEEFDHALPPSQLGHQQYAFLPAEEVAFCKLQRGWMHLEVRDLEGGRRRLLPDYSLFRYLQSYQGALYCVAGAPDRTSTIVQIDVETGNHQVLEGGVQLLPDADLAKPEPFSFPVTTDTRAHGFFYRPANSHHLLKRFHHAPLIIMVHGGPTSATYPVLNPMVQFWTQRGFAVADLNYRGSSGFGREYRQALYHRWGIADVEDVLAALVELERRHWCNTGRAFIRGSSAGGFTALSAVVASGRFLGGCSLYGVSDPWTLRQATHRFESRYLDWLIADARSPERFQARSPLGKAEQITTPMIFFQGGRDKVVVPAQTEAMVAALKGQGLDIAYHYYPGEGHGFRQASTRQHALEQELAFYRKQLVLVSD